MCGLKNPGGRVVKPGGVARRGCQVARRVGVGGGAGLARQVCAGR